MGNIPSKPVITNQQWINGVTKLNQTNLTNGVNQNITNLKTAVDGIIDALGGPGGESASDKTLDQTSISAYDPATTYSQGQVVIHDGKYYRAKENGVTGTWNAAKWSQIALSTPVDPALDKDSTNPVQNAVVTAELAKKTPLITVAPAYDSATVYESGVLLTYNQKLFKCIQDAPAGTLPTDTTYFKEVTVKEELDAKAVLGAFNGGGTGVDYADLANNLIASKGLEVESYFTFEKTGGEQASAIESGNATLKNLYGKTEKSENLCLVEEKSGTTEGVDYAFADGVLKANGTPQTDRYIVFARVKATSTNMVMRYFYVNKDLANTSNGYIYGQTSGGRNFYPNSAVITMSNLTIGEEVAFLLVLPANISYSNMLVYPMLVQGSTAPTEWKQGYEGLKHTHITGLKSTQINIYNPNEEYQRVNPNVAYYVKGTATIAEYDINKNLITSQSVTDTTFTTSSLSHFIKVTTTDSELCINFSNANINGNYYPFEEDTLDIDFDGNGVGTASDEINVEEGKKYQRINTLLDLATLNWTYDSTYDRWWSDSISSLIKESLDNNTAGNLIADLYDNVAVNYLLGSDGNLIGVSSNGRISVKNGSNTTKPSGKLTYELAEPIVTDVTISKDTIKVWNGGSMEALGTEIPVGTKIFYQKNIKNFIEGLGEATNWDPNALSQTFYSTETVSDLANMGALRTFINDINSSGRHCFFDLHNYITDAYVCIIHMWTANGVNYCFVEDLINHKTYGDYSGYADATTISTYLSSNAMSSLRVIKITDANITMADINTLLGEINTLGDHVMFDVSAITTAMYLTTIFISGSYYRVFDSVTGRTAAGNSSSGLTEKLVDVINSGIVNPTSWKDIQQIVREGNAKNVFAPGDQLDVLYLDGISTESSNQSLTVTVNADTFINKMGLSASSYIFTYSSTLNSWTLHEGAVSLSAYGVTVTGTPADGNTITVTTTTRTVVFDIVAFDKDVPADSTYTHSMTIQTHNTVGSVQYSNSQAGFQFPDGLAAGAYCFTIGNYDVTYGGNATYYFTLANAIPAGGQLRFDWPYQQQASTRSVYTYSSSSSSTAIESKPVSTTEIAGAPNIGTLVNSTITTNTITDQGGNTVTVKVNNADRMRYGSNNWENSAMRQWCNSAAAAGSVWSPKSDFDRPPSWVSSANGFLYHIDPELLAVCGEVNKITKKNTVCDGGGTVTTTDRAFPVSMGAIGVNGYMDEEPLGQYDYYKALLGGQIADWSTHVELIKKNSAGTAQYWWLRGPYPSSADNVRIVSPSGYVAGNYAYNGSQAAPALSII